MVEAAGVRAPPGESALPSARSGEDHLRRSRLSIAAKEAQFVLLVNARFALLVTDRARRLALGGGTGCDRTCRHACSGRDGVGRGGSRSHLLRFPNRLH